MGQETGIGWTDSSWNPWSGCHKVSQGCKFCYMFRDKIRYGQDPNVVQRSKTTFTAPLKWPKVPTMCFTCSWSDWLIEEADPWRDEAYDIIRATPWITYQILTKRIERATGRVPDPPLANVWLGVSVENQDAADERIPLLLQTPAAKRFVSYEPALGPVNFYGKGLPYEVELCAGPMSNKERYLGGPFLDWVIVGGESGPAARPFEIAWARNTIAQCKEAGVACFVKQMGSNCVDFLGKMNGAMFDRKGDTMARWPVDVQVQEFPV